MNALKCAYINEMYKISKKKKLIAAAILGVLATIGLAAVFALLNKITGVGMLYGGDFAIKILPLFEYTVIPLFTAFITIDMFSGEFSNETIKLTLTRPVSRAAVYFSKLLAAATFLAGFLIYVMLLATVSSLLCGSAATAVFKTLTAYAATFVPLLIFTLSVALISNIARGSASAFLISVLFFIIMKAAEIALPTYSSFFFTAGFDWYKPILGVYANPGAVLRQLCIFVGYALIFYFSGFYIFEKRSF